jgi:hypothetical protein
MSAFGTQQSLTEGEPNGSKGAVQTLPDGLIS